MGKHKRVERKRSPSRGKTRRSRRDKRRNSKPSSRKYSSSSSSFYSDSQSESEQSISSRSPSNSSYSSRDNRRNKKRKDRKHKERKEKKAVKEEENTVKQQNQDGDETPKIERNLSELPVDSKIKQKENIQNDNPQPIFKEEDINQTEFQGIELKSRMTGENTNHGAVELFSSFKKINHTDIPNVHRKLIIYNLPPTTNEDEIKQYFLTILNTLNPNMKLVNPILSLEKNLVASTNKDNTNTSISRTIGSLPYNIYYIFELATKDDIEILKAMNNTEWRNYRMRIEKPASFFREYNNTQGRNIEPKESKSAQQQSILDESDNKIYMGGIPPNAKEHEIREIVESFGQLKSFHLVKDTTSEEDFNRGFCFFEYEDERVTDRAIKGLNGKEMGQKRLKVQRAAVNSKSFSIAKQLKENPIEIVPREFGQSNFSDVNPNIQEDENGYMPKVNLQNYQIDVPVYATIPSRVVLLINLISPEDVMEDADYREISEDIRAECMQFGTVLNVEIPRPDKTTWIASPAVGKIFVKFSTLLSAKRARYNLSGRKFNRRTVVAAFYPENHFDVREFNYQG